MNHRSIKWVGLATVMLLLGCKPKLSSSLTINGVAFSPTACKSLEPKGASGVELEDSSGKKLGLQALVGGQALVFVFSPGAAVGTPVGTCGSISVQRQNSKINDVYNVKGNATLSNCTDGVTTVSGSVTFENCH